MTIETKGLVRFTRGNTVIKSARWIPTQYRNPVQSALYLVSHLVMGVYWFCFPVRG